MAQTVAAVSTRPEGQVGSRVGIESILASIIQLLAATQSKDDPEGYIKILRELAFERLNSISFEDLNKVQTEAVFHHARETIKSVFDPNLTDTSRSPINS